MSFHYLAKEFYDYADDIEGVNIHYVWTVLGGTPDWEHHRATRYMPLVQSASQLRGAKDTSPSSQGTASSVSPRLRKKVLKLPQRIPDQRGNMLTDRYLLHHYFEVFQDGHRYYSPLYTEEIVTGVGPQSAMTEAADVGQEGTEKLGTDNTE